MHVEISAQLPDQLPSYDAHISRSAALDHDIQVAQQAERAARLQMRAAEDALSQMHERRTQLDTDWTTSVIEAGPLFGSAFFLEFGIVGDVRGRGSELKQRYELATALCNFASSIDGNDPIPALFLNGKRGRESGVDKAKGFSAVVGSVEMEGLVVEHDATVDVQTGARTLTPKALKLVISDSVRISSDVRLRDEFYLAEEPSIDSSDQSVVALAYFNRGGEVKVITHDIEDEDSERLTVTFSVNPNRSGNGWNGLCVGSIACAEGFKSFEHWIKDGGQYRSDALSALKSELVKRTSLVE